MRPRLLLAITVSTLSLGAFSAAVPVSAMAEDGSARAAQSMAKAERELARTKTERAVRYAEEAVELAPMSVAARELLARSYLSDGRLTSADAAYRDLLALSPGDSGATLNLALVRVALGDGEGARALLGGAELPVADKGLGLVLAGDLAGGGRLLESAAQADGADGRVRQNLAFAYAMAGDWRRARVVASQDLDPATVHQRIGEWAQVATPRNSWDQVAYLLNIKPVEDSGQPAKLALNRSPVPQMAVEPQADALAIADEPAPDTVTGVLSAAVADAAVAESVPEVLPAFVARPVVQAAVRPRPVVAEAKLIPASVTVARPLMRFTSGGRYVLQLGAYVTPGAAERGWSKAAGRANLSNATPLASKVTVRGQQFTRLAAGRFDSRGEANALCRAIKAKGGDCFVREVMGDDTPRWASRAKDVVASR